MITLPAVLPRPLVGAAGLAWLPVAPVLGHVVGALPGVLLYPPLLPAETPLLILGLPLSTNTETIFTLYNL